MHHFFRMKLPDFATSLYDLLARGAVCARQLRVLSGYACVSLYLSLKVDAETLSHNQLSKRHQQLKRSDSFPRALPGNDGEHAQM